jgi:hypothetical protein
MKKIFMLMAFIAALFLAGCGNDSVVDDNPDNNNSYKGATLTAFTDDVQTCTPYIPGIVFSSGTSAVDVWAGWPRNNSNGVLGRVFNTTIQFNNDESIYTQIATLDDHIALVNKFTDYFDEDGSFEVGSDTAAVDTSVSSVDVPFMGWSFQEPVSVPVDRIVTVTSGSLIVHMGFKKTGTSEVIVEQYTDGSTKAGAYYTIRDGSYLAVWHASVRDGKVQFMWDGDMDNQTFRISECSDTDDNWEVMGGGSVETGTSLMSFMARNNFTDGSDDAYYIWLSLQDFNTEAQKTVYTASVNPPDGTGPRIYITEDNENCLGFYRTGDYPDSVSDLEWDN